MKTFRPACSLIQNFLFFFDFVPTSSSTSSTTTSSSTTSTTTNNSGYPIAGATFTQDGYMLQRVAASNVGTLGLVLAVLVRLYSGWGYVASRLQSKVIEYEETGWYDGNLEPKTEVELKRDRFLYQSNVKPVVDRLKRFTLTAGGLWVASCIALNTVASMKPMFNEYDPAMLERVRYDDDLADIAARQSQGRPTYCDNRYYRAVANGGQGEKNRR